MKQTNKEANKEAGDNKVCLKITAKELKDLIQTSIKQNTVNLHKSTHVVDKSYYNGKIDTLNAVLFYFKEA